MTRLSNLGTDKGVTVRVAGLELVIGDALIDALVERVAERLDELPVAPEPFITAQQAAEHLACGIWRIRSLTAAGRIPVHREGRRTLYRVSELNAWVEAGGGKRP